MEIEFSNEFKKIYEKIKDKNLRNKIIKQILKLKQSPLSGKPLKNDFKNHRTIRVSPFRIIYKIEKNKLLFVTFEHRGKVYEKFK